MHRLDNLTLMRRLDSQGMIGSIESVGLQCQQAWDESRQVKLPASYRNCTSIVVSGMGGSALGAHMIQSVFGGTIPVPMQIVNGYALPGSVNSRTLVVLSSYSGTTEEVLATATIARRKKAKVFVLCAGGALATLAKRYRWPAYVFEPRFNPSNQPRMATGYSIMAIAGLLRQLKLISLSDAAFRQGINAILAVHRSNGVRVPLRRNAAKQLATTMHRTIPFIIGAEHTAGNAHTLANQLNENSKNTAGYFLLSELNHHLMEGLSYPTLLKRAVSFVLFSSPLYSSGVRRRVPLTVRVIKKAGLSSFEYRLAAPTAFSQSLEMLTVGSYAGLYLAILNNIDPSPIPVVDFFKHELAKPATKKV